MNEQPEANRARMEIFDKILIQKYSERNTSPKMPIERKYVYAFLDSMLNSSTLGEKWKLLMDEMQNGDAYVFFNSFWRDAKIVNKEPNRSVVAYSMLKKDMRLFELMSAAMFTGSVEEYRGSDLFRDVVKYTDEAPMKYTDAGSYTDVHEGTVQIGFKNLFCDDPFMWKYVPDYPGQNPQTIPVGYEWQTLEEILKATTEFEVMATMCKPARVVFLLFMERWCFLSGNRNEMVSCGMEIVYQSPFGPIAGGANTGMDVLDGMSDLEVMKCYDECSMKVVIGGISSEKEITWERTSKREAGFLTLSYEFKTQEVEGVTWGRIKIQPNVSDRMYVREIKYKEGEEHCQKMVPLMLSMGDGSGNVLAFNLTDDIAGMFYVREKAGE